MTNEAPATARSVRRDWALLGGATFLFAFGFAVYNGIFQNFARERIGIQPHELGLLESLREVPGLLAAFLAGTLVAWAEPRVAGLALAVCGIGMALTGRAGSYWPLVGVSVLWSVGFHLWISVQPALTMALARGREGGRRLGQIASVNAVAVLIALGITRLLKPHSTYASLFYLAGTLILFAGAAALLLSANAHGLPRSRLVYRDEYRLYYLLSFLEGCRRQVFMTFASFTLIAVYRTPVETMLTLAFINALLNAFIAPVVGRWMDRLGERPLMTRYYVALALLFAGYATLRDPNTLYMLYVLDSALTAFAIGLTTYLQKIVRPGELTPSLAMGTTWNHVAAVGVPVMGGWIWHTSGSYQLPFWIGVGLALFSALAARRLPQNVRGD